MDKLKMYEKLTVRLYPSQMLVLTELKDKLGCTISLLVRSIIRDFLINNEESIERIISNENPESNANYKSITEKTEKREK